MGLLCSGLVNPGEPLAGEGFGSGASQDTWLAVVGKRLSSESASIFLHSCEPCCNIFLLQASEQRVGQVCGVASAPLSGGAACNAKG